MQTTKDTKAKFNVSLKLVSIFVTTIIFYFLAGFHYQKVFFPATTINGVNVSGLTPSQAQEAVNADIQKYILTLEEDAEKTEQITGADIGLRAEDTGTLHTLLEGQNMFTWGVQGFFPKEYTLDIRYDEEKLRSAISALSCMDKKQWISPENAYIRYEKSGGYQIVPEIPGNKILEDKFFDAVADAVCHLENCLSLRDTGVYAPPKIISEDSSLQRQLALLQSYSDMTVTYQFGSQSEVLNGDTISDWITYSKRGNIIIDREAVTEFVKGLAKKYNTAYSSKTLETSYGETVTIKNGYYGWQIDRETEVENLMEILRKGCSVTTEPAYLLKAASHGDTDYGDTYVEINLTAQHLFYYKDGELIVESDFVSGNPSHGNDTPAGAYSITYKEKNATLRGQNYATPVSYWMPFNGNIGMHDSSWRSAFGGSIYQTNGSHGCINLPPAIAKTIFENIEQGIPVLCYHLDGTQQAYATGLSGEKVITKTIVPEPEPEIMLPPQEEAISPVIPVRQEEGAVTPDILPQSVTE